MKTRFTTIDIVVIIKELHSLLGMRLINVYDIDNKTYLLKLSSKEKKNVLLIESGSRLHMTDFEWPKNPAPSGFTMKLRKHIHNRRLESVKQLGIDRILDLQFGSNEAAYHIILELYDKGNVVLTDYQYTILNILRPRSEDELKFIVRNTYPVENAKQPEPLIAPERLQEILSKAKHGDNLKRVLNPHLPYGPAVIEHVLLGAGFSENAKIGKSFDPVADISKLLTALEEAECIMNKKTDEIGFIIQKKEKRTGENGMLEEFLVYQEFHPFLYRQHEALSYVTFPSFNKAVDEFFSKLEGQKIDMKAMQMEKEALKKLENVKKDHDRRLDMLEKSQENDKHKAQLIEMNLELVDSAITAVQSALASQMSWKEIGALIHDAQLQGDPVSKAIKSLKLEINHISLLLSDPYFDYDVDDEESQNNVAQIIDVDLDLSAYANAKKYYDLKRYAAKKEQRTIESTAKALKSAEKKTKQTLKDVATFTNIKKARKVHWFEKFYWFISSENYLVIGGRDQQQNELIVKRYMRSGDVYVHADLHGASSVVIKNPAGGPIPPKTLNEAGTMTVCYSSAWDAKVVTSAWWVYPDQVTKTAPTGEYLTTGSFMIRGKKNYLPPCHLIMGFGIFFKLDEESIPNHKDERKLKVIEGNSEVDDSSVIIDDIDVDLSEGSDEVAEEDGHILAGDNQEKSNGKEELPTDSEPVSNDNEELLLMSFPDTIVKLEPVPNEQFSEEQSSVLTTEDLHNLNSDTLGGKKPVMRNKPNSKLHCENQLTERTATQDVANRQPSDLKTSNPNEKVIKRGQKYKLKKMKEKYKDQDDLDREIAMELLKPAGPAKEPKHKKDKKKQGTTKATTRLINAQQISAGQGRQVLDVRDVKMTVEKDPLTSKTNLLPVEDDVQGSDDEKEKLHQQEDENLLSSLTGIPIVEDVLLFAIPVCGPYNSMMNFKYKVKLTPGTGKRGKAAKTAIAMFLHDKSTTSREKDVIRSLKDQEVARNIPGKVKMSAPQLQKLKR